MIMSKSYLYIVNKRGAITLIRCIARAIITGSFFLLITTQLTAQAQWTDAIQDQFDNYRRHNLQEKIFVHTDKNFYVPGEICWFKIYNVDAYFHQPIDLGKVAYIEILDKNSKAVL